MANLTNILSLNVGMNAGLAGLTTLLSVFPADLILLQEVRISNDQINSLLCGLGFSAEVNIDNESPSSPGTAFAWRNSMSQVEVFNIVKCRCQMIKIGCTIVVNVYAPSGSAKRHERSMFFGQDILEPFLCLTILRS